jgi:hypothetical protein
MNPEVRDQPTPGDRPPNPAERFAIGLEYVVAAGLTLAVIAIHIRYFLNAGGLWRDEVTSVNLANTNPLSLALANLHNDSFPGLWLLVVRFYQRIFNNSDRSMRTFGLLVGLSLVAVLWRNARRFGGRTPTVSLALLGFTSAVTCYGDSIRAYGLGMLLGLLVAGLIWNFARKQTLISFVAALIPALLCVHTLYFNCVLVLAACCGVIALTIPARNWKCSAWVLILGLICATSMLIYLPTIAHTRELTIFQRSDTLARLIFAALTTLEFLPDGNVNPGFSSFWWCLIVATIIYLVPVRQFFRGFKELPRERREVIVFSSVFLVVGTFAYLAFLKILSYPPQPWYYLAAIAIVASSMDGFMGAAKSPTIRIVLTLGVLIFAGNAAEPVWINVAVRRTNVDLIAAQLEQSAAKDDLIVFAPWNRGITFLRYYHGPAQVVGIPPVSSLAFQQYSLVMKFVAEQSQMQPLIERANEILHAGHRVWVVGDDDFPSYPPEPIRFQSSAGPLSGWVLGYYQFTWRDEVFYALRHNSQSVRVVSVSSDRPVNSYETAFLSEVEGWKDHPAPATRPQ